jgi:hypothetical protein
MATTAPGIPTRTARSPKMMPDTAPASQLLGCSITIDGIAEGSVDDSVALRRLEDIVRCSIKN